MVNGNAEDTLPHKEVGRLYTTLRSTTNHSPLAQNQVLDKDGHGSYGEAMDEPDKALDADQESPLAPVEGPVGQTTATSKGRLRSWQVMMTHLQWSSWISTGSWLRPSATSTAQLFPAKLSPFMDNYIADELNANDTEVRTFSSS
ncbi:hypothetical protein H920_04264 [Fukomys damarensis]|uniref:Uncharacterized protein n=1 Tax=Fukomys damarensis TaxID=885580 RepID=A0A091EG00_FUKDA|nr:hypothetical protein H920_04264 [Fukomys damarensis]